MTKLPLFPTFGKALKKTFVEMYQSMSLMLIYSLLWFIAHLPVFLFLTVNVIALLNGIQNSDQVNQLIFAFAIFMMVVVLWYGLVVGPLMTTLYGMLQVRKEDYIGIKTFFSLFKKHYWLSARVYWLLSLALTILSINLIIGVIGKNVLFLGISVFSLYLFILVSFMSFYVSPLIYFNNRFKGVIRKAFLLVLDNFWLTALTGLTIGIFFVLSTMVAAPLVFIFGAFYLFIMDSVFDPILEKYESKTNLDDNGGEKV